MAKNSVRDFDATAANNTDIQSVDISEGCAPSGINNAIRELMTDLKNVSSGAIALETPSADSMTVTGDLTVDTNTLKVDSTNNRVGVANASPSVELDVTGAAAISGDLTVDTSTLKVDSTNNRVGIANASPAVELDVTGSASISGDLTIAHAIVHSGDTDTKIRFPSNNTIAFEAAGGERGRFSSGGSFFVGTTANPSTTNFGHKLTANGEFRHFKDSSATAEVGRAGGNAGLFLVRGDGDLENTNNRYSGISDQNLKENIVDASSQWDDIKAVRVRKYSLIEKGLDAPDSIGVIAQELEASDMGGLVKDVDEGYKTVAYSVLYMKAVKALQEAMERIEALEARVTTLEG